MKNEIRTDDFEPVNQNQVERDNPTPTAVRNDIDTNYRRDIYGSAWRQWDLLDFDEQHRVRSEFFDQRFREFEYNFEIRSGRPERRPVR